MKGEIPCLPCLGGQPVVRKHAAECSTRGVVIDVSAPAAPAESTAPEPVTMGAAAPAPAAHVVQCCGGKVKLVGVWPTGYTRPIANWPMEAFDKILPLKPAADSEACYRLFKHEITMKALEEEQRYGAASVVKLTRKGKPMEWTRPCTAELHAGEVLAVVLGTKNGEPIAAIGQNKYWSCTDCVRYRLNTCCDCTICTFFHFQQLSCFKQPVRSGKLPAKVPEHVFHLDPAELSRLIG